MITAAFTDRLSLICVIPSRRSNGVYLVQIAPRGLELIVSHDCPAMHFREGCKHIPEVVSAYETLHWWEPKKRVVVEKRRVVLHPDWKQLPVPKTSTEQLREWICNDS